VSAGRHIALVRRTCFDVDDAVKEIGLPVLPTEVLMPILADMGTRSEAQALRNRGTYSAYDILMVGKVCLTCLAAVDLAAAEVGVVSQPHDAGPHGKARAGLVW
jgi:hypothetical protein